VISSGAMYPPLPGYRRGRQVRLSFGGRGIPPQQLWVGKMLEAKRPVLPPCSSPENPALFAGGALTAELQKA